jgi:hypothetical protein
LFFTLWLPWPMAWALRRQAARAVPRGHRLPWLSRQVHRAMAVLVLCELANGLLSGLVAGGDARLAAVVWALEAVRWLALGVLLWVWLGGLVARRP